jgi:hypothetical protein
MGDVGAEYLNNALQNNTVKEFLYLYTSYWSLLFVTDTHHNIIRGKFDQSARYRSSKGWNTKATSTI